MGQAKELEERTGQFQREASEGAHMISQLEATLNLEEEARRKLESVVERQSAELERWRVEAASQKANAQRADLELEDRIAALHAMERNYEEARIAAAEDSSKAKAEIARLMEQMRELTKDRDRAQESAASSLKQALEEERKKLLAQVKTAMESAEAVRREGIEALEQARALKK
jgi:hypothetical protein